MIGHTLSTIRWYTRLSGFIHDHGRGDAMTETKQWYTVDSVSRPVSQRVGRQVPTLDPSPDRLLVDLELLHHVRDLSLIHI